MQTQINCDKKDKKEQRPLCIGSGRGSRLEGAPTMVRRRRIIEAPQVTRILGLGRERAYPSPCSRLGGLGDSRKPISGIRGETTATNDFMTLNNEAGDTRNTIFL